MHEPRCSAASLCTYHLPPPPSTCVPYCNHVCPLTSPSRTSSSCATPLPSHTGHTPQHIQTDAIQDWIERVAHVPVDGRDGVPDVCVIELGGTVGDIESMPFVEALRQFQFKVGPGNMCIVHVSLVPIIGVVGEQKTKPTQHSVAVLRSLGLHPHLLACRCSEPLEESVRQKLVGGGRCDGVWWARWLAWAHIGMCCSTVTALQELLCSQQCQAV